MILSLFDTPSIERVETPEGRVYQKDRVALPSITRVLSKVFHSDALDQWIENVGYQQAEFIKNEAAAYGTLFHEAIEDQIIHQKPAKSLELVRETAHVLEFFNKFVSEVHAMEYPLYDPSIGVAGTTDCIAKTGNGQLAIIDFKTYRNTIPPEVLSKYFLQVATYAAMVENTLGLKVNHLIILAKKKSTKLQTNYQEYNRDVWIPKIEDMMTRFHFSKRVHEVDSSGQV